MNEKSILRDSNAGNANQLLGSDKKTPKNVAFGQQNVHLTPLKKSIGTPIRTESRNATPLRKAHITKTPLKPFLVGKPKASPISTLSTPLKSKIDQQEPKSVRKSTLKFSPLAPQPYFEPLVTPANKVSIKTPSAVKKVQKKLNHENIEDTPTCNTSIFTIDNNYVPDLSGTTQLQRYAKNQVYKFSHFETKLAPILIITFNDCLKVQV